MNFENYVRNPDITVYKGLKVKKDTNIEFKSKNGKQKIKNLIYTRWEKIEAENYTTETKTTVPLKEGQLVLFNGEEQGYVIPLEQFKTLDEAIEDIEAMKEE